MSNSNCRLQQCGRLKQSMNSSSLKKIARLWRSYILLLFVRTFYSSLRFFFARNAVRRVCLCLNKPIQLTDKFKVPPSGVLYSRFEFMSLVSPSNFFAHLSALLFNLFLLHCLCAAPFKYLFTHPYYSNLFLRFDISLSIIFPLVIAVTHSEQCRDGSPSNSECIEKRAALCISIYRSRPVVATAIHSPADSTSTGTKTKQVRVCTGQLHG